MGSRAVGLVMLLILQPSDHAAAINGRLSLLGTSDRIQSSYQLGLRLMAEQREENHEWILHLRTIQQQLSGVSSQRTHSSALFRYRRGGGSLSEEHNGESSRSRYYEFDRAFYRHDFDLATLSIGRQPIDWGSGRFWQPTNLFGSFTPTDLDTEYKPGIDALNLEWFPTPYSALSMVYAFAPQQQNSVDNSYAFHFRQPIGLASEMTLAGGNINRHRMVGGSIESSWGESGWWLEGRYARQRESRESAFLWVAGMERRLSEKTLLQLEWYNNNRGASNEQALAAVAQEPLITQGLQLQMSRNLLGVSLNQTLTPLLNGSYTLLASRLESGQKSHHSSLLHQLSLSFSVSDESDLLLSLTRATGQPASTGHHPQSEFGHLPDNLTLRLRLYF
ncbi:MAG: hypothetical protein HN842_01270 [Gammaproteobacteria bacterium]|jgi:hypothetical protein|nr:hypothetical protein [Gammaproteobacteria bacterium]MBT7306813.1 hypothetical protein [Gammaproteobacteria bacterium]